MKKKIVASVVGILLFPLMLTGCGAHKNTSETLKVTYIDISGDAGTAVMFILTSDCVVKKYEMRSDYVNQYDLFGGELPPNNEYTMTEYRMSEKEWETLVGAINDNNFLELPEELPPYRGVDAPAYYLQVETVDGVYKSGGYGAGHGDDKANKRFRLVKDELDNIVWNQ